MAYRVVLSDEAADFVRTLDTKCRRQVVKRLDSLKAEPFPRGSFPLKNSRYRRCRSGDYRILYVVDRIIEVVDVADIGLRKDIYGGH